jgi:hypothetical protein
MTEFIRTESTGNGRTPGAAVAAGVLHEAEAWTSVQCELLSRMGAIWTDWLHRQQEAIDASARSLQQMCDCRNPADLAQLQQEWLAGAARRGASDITALASDSMALTWRAVGADRLGGHGPSPAVRGTARAKVGDEAPVHREAAE